MIIKRIDELHNLSLNIFRSVSKIITILLTIVFCYLSIIVTIKPSEFIPIFSMVLGDCFDKSIALDTPRHITSNSSEDINKYE